MTAHEIDIARCRQVADEAVQLYDLLLRVRRLLWSTRVRQVARAQAWVDVRVEAGDVDALVGYSGMLQRQLREIRHARPEALHTAMQRRDEETQTRQIAAESESS